jgi:hypothetical protein
MKKLYLNNLKYVLDNYEFGVEIIKNTYERVSINKLEVVYELKENVYETHEMQGYEVWEINKAKKTCNNLEFSTYEKLLDYLKNNNLITDDYVNVNYFGIRYNTYAELEKEIYYKYLTFKELVFCDDFNYFSLTRNINSSTQETIDNKEFALLKSQYLLESVMNEEKYYQRASKEFDLPPLENIKEIINTNYGNYLKKPNLLFKDLANLTIKDFSIPKSVLKKFIMLFAKEQQIKSSIASLSSGRVIGNKEELLSSFGKGLINSFIDYNYKITKDYQMIQKTLYFKLDHNSKMWLLQLPNEYSLSVFSSIKFYNDSQCIIEINSSNHLRLIYLLGKYIDNQFANILKKN